MDGDVEAGESLAAILDGEFEAVFIDKSLSPFVLRTSSLPPFVSVSRWFSLLRTDGSSDLFCWSGFLGSHESSVGVWSRDGAVFSFFFVFLSSFLAVLGFSLVLLFVFCFEDFLLDAVVVTVPARLLLSSVSLLFLDEFKSPSSESSESDVFFSPFFTLIFVFLEFVVDVAFWLEFLFLLLVPDLALFCTDLERVTDRLLSCFGAWLFILDDEDIDELSGDVTEEVDSNELFMFDLLSLLFELFLVDVALFIVVFLPFTFEVGFVSVNCKSALLLFSF